MSAAKAIEQFHQNAVAYTIREHPRLLPSKETSDVSHLPPNDIAKAVILGDRRGCVMAVTPSDRRRGAP